MKKFRLLTALLGAILLSSCSSIEKKDEKISVANVPTTTLIDHKIFQVYYDQSYRLPRYVVYIATAEQMQKSIAKRKNNFIADPIIYKLGLPITLPKEYAHSGYDQGHMAPAGDFMWSQEANDKTFVMSNMAPQLPNLNRASWRLLEDQVRKWACGEKRIIVITGPILEENLPTLKSGLAIPKEFFKIIIDDTSPRKAIGFIYHQSDKGNPINERTAEIKTITQKANISIKDYVATNDVGILNRKTAIAEWKSKDCL